MRGSIQYQRQNIILVHYGVTAGWQFADTKTTASEIAGVNTVAPGAGTGGGLSGDEPLQLFGWGGVMYLSPRNSMNLGLLRSDTC